MLGKRPRVPSMRRTTSMSQMGSGSCNPVSEHVPKEKQRATFPVASQLRAAGSGHTSVQNCSNGVILSNQIQISSLGAQFHFRLGNSDIQSQKPISNSIAAASELRGDRFLSIMEATPSVGGSSGSVYDVRFVEPAHFLQACFLCTRRLGHGQDIYMYRDDRAFCSAECRYQQIVIDENAEKHSLKVMATGSVPPVRQHNIGKNVQSRKVKNNQSGRCAAA